MARPSRTAGIGLAALLFTTPATAQTVIGYQLGVIQTAGGTFGDDNNPLLDANPDNPAAVQQIQGVQLSTTVSGNVTADIVTNTLNHGLALGVAYTQLFPFAVPETAQATLRDRLSTVNAVAAYLARIQEARWGLQFGAGYTFGLNGRLQNGAAGGVTGDDAGTLPAANAGAFAFNARTHTFAAQIQHTLNRRRWDLLSGVNYTYTINGLFTLAAGGFGAQNAAGAVGTNVGAFIPQNVHALTPQLEYRRRFDARNTFILSGSAALSVTEEVEDQVVTDENGRLTIVPAQFQIPSTIVNTLDATWTYNATLERVFGATANAVFGLRPPTDPNGMPIPESSYRSDTFIWTLRAFYQDLLPLETRLTIGAGVAQATLFQPPLGVPGDPELFEPVRSNLTPIADITLQRRFEPVEVSLIAARAVGVGAFGASAIVTDNAALVFTHVSRWEMPLTTTVGFNAQRTRAVGQELFRGVAPNDPIAVAFNNQGYGAVAQIAYPLYRDDPFAFDVTASYNFTYNDLDPEDVTGFEPIRQHIALLALRGTFGRGAAQQAVGAGGRRDTDELDAFSANPRDGAPLVTQRLLTQGAPMLDRGSRPGLPPEPTRRDSRQQYQQDLRQETLDREARERSDAVLGEGTYAEEEARKQKAERERQERAEEERKREFEPWPMDAVPLPQSEPEAAPR